MYSNSNNPFNLMATLLAMTIATSTEPESTLAISSASDQLCYRQALAILQPYREELRDAATIGLTSQTICNIVKQCEGLPFSVLHKIVLELDYYFSWEQLIEEQGDAEPFRALNDNIEETHIRVLPRVPVPSIVYEGHSRRDAHSFYDRINSELRNCYYIKEDALIINGVHYEVKNVIYNPELRSKNREKLTVAFSPLINLPMDDTLEIKYFQREGKNGIVYNLFSVLGLKDEQLCFNRYKNLYQKACEFDADIVMGPEMLCPLGLYEIDELRYNQHLRQWSSQKKTGSERAPALILIPSFWKNGRNNIRVFNRNGKLLLEQDKQYPFTHRKQSETAGLGEKYTENLENSQYCIWLLHIPYWGRLVFPICMDFLQPLYQDLLIRELQSTLILCSSYSAGNANFERALASGVQFQATAFWGNSCSALQPHLKECGYTGAVLLPNIGKKASPLRLELRCQEICGNGCAFIVQVPLNYAGQTRWQDTGATYHHEYPHY